MVTLNLWKRPPTPHQRPKNEHDEAHINSLDAKIHNQDLDPKASFSLMSLFSSYLLLHISQLTGKWPYNHSGLARCEQKWRVSFLAEAVKIPDTVLQYFSPLWPTGEATHSTWYLRRTMAKSSAWGPGNPQEMWGLSGRKRATSVELSHWDLGAVGNDQSISADRRRFGSGVFYICISPLTQKTFSFDIDADIKTIKAWRRAFPKALTTSTERWSWSE